MNQNEYDELLSFLKEGCFPKSLSRQQRWNFQKKASLYFVPESGILFKKMNIRGEEKDLEVASSSELQGILEKYHDQIAHPGINSSVKSIKQRYYWLGLYSDVSNYVKSCDICQRTASLPPQPQRKLQPIPPTERPWKHIGIDLICDLSPSTEGFIHILVTVCYLSKYVVVRPLKTKTTAEVIENLQDIYLEISLPNIIQHDQGKEFTSGLFQEFHRRLKVDNRSTHAYHPMANGLVEAHNKILKTKLNKIAIQTGRHWSLLLKSSVLCMNSTEKKSHSYTPFEVMWGRESRYQDLIPHIDNIKVSHEEDLQLEEAILEEFLPMEEEMIDVFSSPLDDPLQSIHLMEESRQKVCELAGDSIRSEQLKQKRQ